MILLKKRKEEKGKYTARVKSGFIYIDIFAATPFKYSPRSMLE